MNIKKFEARSMKEALEMVKVQLGPDAVILSAKEVSKSYGLGGVKSIEITAAYSETTLKQKEYVKSKMPQAKQETFNRIAAKSQREIMQRVIEDKIRESQAKERSKFGHLNFSTEVEREEVAKPASRATRRYIDIDADNNPKTEVRAIPKETIAVPTKQPNVLTEQAKNAWSNMEVQSLKGEIDELKRIILDFKKVPQGFVTNYAGSEYGINPNLKDHFENLVKKGIMPDIAGDLMLEVQNQCDPNSYRNHQVIESTIAKCIMDSSQIDFSTREKFHLFVGPSGSGKSSSMIKLASRLMLQENKRVALISTDTVKVGADEQMKIFSQILNIPFVSIRSPSDWNRILPYLNQVDHVLVDFASLSLRSEEEMAYISQMIPPVAEKVRTHLVFSAKSKDIDLIETGDRYRALHIDDIIFTSLDEARQFGTIYNTIQKLNLPLFAFGIGSKIPNDFEVATKERVVDLILEITKSLTAAREASL